MKLVAVLACGLALLPAGGASAQTYPSQSVRMVVPFSSGGLTDSLARIVGDRLERLWKQSVLIENRPGLPGTTSVARSTPDGYTLIMTSSGHVIARALSKNAAFDPVADFSGITRVAELPFLMIASPQLPARTLPEFIALVRSQPGKYNYGSSGIASSAFLMAETFRQVAQLQLVHVPFKGAPDALTAVMRGDVAFYLGPLTEGSELASAGKVRLLAISSEQRSKHLPEVPTIKEAGLASFSYSSWFGLMAPAKTPREVIARIHADVLAVLKQPEVLERLDKLGSVPMPNTPADFDALIKSDAAKYTEVLKVAGIEAK